jgi:hypothetical protein
MEAIMPNRFARNAAIKSGVVLGSAAAQTLIVPGLAYDAAAAAWDQRWIEDEDPQVAAEDSKVLEAALSGSKTRTTSRFAPQPPAKGK